MLDALAEEIRTLLAAEPRTLLVVASYHIGKEKVYLGLARRLGIKVTHIYIYSHTHSPD